MWEWMLGIGVEQDDARQGGSLGTRLPTRDDQRNESKNEMHVHASKTYIGTKKNPKA
jgi:hypothetical protein